MMVSSSQIVNRVCQGKPARAAHTQTKAHTCSSFATPQLVITTFNLSPSLFILRIGFSLYFIPFFATGSSNWLWCHWQGHRLRNLRALHPQALPAAASVGLSFAAPCPPSRSPPWSRRTPAVIRKAPKLSAIPFLFCRMLACVAATTSSPTWPLHSPHRCLKCSSTLSPSISSNSAPTKTRTGSP